MKKTMEAYGFDNQWIKWVMALVSMTSFPILVNGAPTKPFYPSRGIRQGDPLTPFLFILMMEGLIRTIKEATSEGVIKGLQPHKAIPPTMHKKFVDDTMLHGIATVKEATAYKEILDNFAEASGTKFNHSKSMIFFFNTHIDVQRNLTNILGFKRKTLPTKYLGVPLTDKVGKKSTWENMINKRQDRVKIWTYQALKFVGMLVLTKVVL
jgi:hypothetical protein